MVDFTTRLLGGRPAAKLKNVEVLIKTIDTSSGGYRSLIALNNAQAIAVYEAGWNVKCFRAGVRLSNRVSLNEDTLYFDAKYPPIGYPLPGEEHLESGEKLDLELLGWRWDIAGKTGIRAWLREVKLAK